MSSLSIFNRMLGAFGKKVEQEGLNLFKTTITTVATEVATRTPIDTSRARTNWQSTIGSPVTSEVPFVSGMKGSTASEALQIVTASANTTASRVKLGDRAYCSNPVPYIHDLNNFGTSPQAARNFVQHAVEVAKAKVAK